MALKVYPRPPGGPEPVSPGVSDRYPDSNASYSPGYDVSGSLDGATVADAKKGYRDRRKLTGTDSDGMKTA